MARSTGAQTRIGTLVPGLTRIKPVVNLSKAAKLRLAWIDYYHLHDDNAPLTCRHYGIARSCLHKWLKRFEIRGIAGLETVSTRPKQIRQSDVPTVVVDTVRLLRKANPEYSKYKLAVILRRDYGYVLSPSTIGRILIRYQLFFTPPIRPKGHPRRRTYLARTRKPKDFTVDRPGRLIEFDVKHLPSLGTKRYGFVAIDVMSKQATVHVAQSISSHQAAIAWNKTVYQLGLPDAVVTDNGSENLGAFADLLKTQTTEHYFARPRTPKDKPYVERLIGTIERECLQWGGVATDLQDQQSTISSWLIKYHSYRPHESLDYLTPDQYQAKLEADVFSMY